MLYSMFESQFFVAFLLLLCVCLCVWVDGPREKKIQAVAFLSPVCIGVVFQGIRCQKWRQVSFTQFVDCLHTSLPILFFLSISFNFFSLLHPSEKAFTFSLLILLYRPTKKNEKAKHSKKTLCLCSVCVLCCVCACVRECERRWWMCCMMVLYVFCMFCMCGCCIFVAFFTVFHPRSSDVSSIENALSQRIQKRDNKEEDEKEDYFGS